MKIKRIIKIAYNCIIEEVNSWPALGLVSAMNSGSHKDMNIKTFKKSAKIFINYFNNIYYNFNNINEFEDLRKLGIVAENKMFKATNNVNTHKGLVFAFGIIFFTFLKIYFKKMKFKNWVSEIKIFVKPIKNDLHLNSTSIGLNLYKKLKINGARQTALSGYEIVFQAIKEIDDITKKQPHLLKKEINFILLLYFYLNISDTTVINKIGIEQYKKTRNTFKNLYKKIKNNYQNHYEEINKINQWSIDNNISPGGCADLIVITLFILKIRVYI